MSASLALVLVLLTRAEVEARATEAAPAPAASRLALAANVAAWARDAGDPDAMVAAAELLRANAGAGLTHASGSPEIDADRLFDEAAALSQDSAASARVATRRAADPRGIARAMGDTGPIGRLIQIAPNRPLTFALTARGSEQALLHIGPTGGGDLEVTVQDDRGRSLCFERAPGRPVLCRWRPAFTTTYRVQIRVVSAVPVTTVITSN